MPLVVLTGGAMDGLVHPVDPLDMPEFYLVCDQVYRLYQVCAGYQGVEYRYYLSHPRAIGDETVRRLMRCQKTSSQSKSDCPLA